MRDPFPSQRRGRTGESRFGGVLGESYDLISSWLPTYRELQDVIAIEIAKRYSAPRILDIGVGTGATTKAILSTCRDARIAGVDNDKCMLKRARLRFVSELEAGVVRLYEADALDFLRGMADNSVDVVASALTFHNLRDTFRARAEREILRVLAPGGMFVNSDKYAVDDRDEYLREVVNAILSFDVLIPMCRDDLRRVLIEHEIVDQEPERIMRTSAALERLNLIGFGGVSIVSRLGQYAAVIAFKPRGFNLPGQN